ncbi:hypothetical protein Jiend_06170 [Micromonospora endophytica]|nr:hypothetical protein Jiend_06170 [Micromonospora endophytica]
MQPDLVRAVGLGQRHLHVLGERGRNVLADIVGADRQLPVPPVDEHRELHRRRPTEVTQRVERGPDRPAGEEHVVDEDDPPAVDPPGRQLGGADRAGGVPAQVVAVERDVEHTDRHGDTFEGADPGGEAVRERGASGRDAEQYGVGRALGLLQDLVRDPVDDALDIRVCQNHLHRGLSR